MMKECFRKLNSFLPSLHCVPSLRHGLHVIILKMMLVTWCLLRIQRIMMKNLFWFPLDNHNFMITNLATHTILNGCNHSGNYRRWLGLYKLANKTKDIYQSIVLDFNLLKSIICMKIFKTFKTISATCTNFQKDCNQKPR